VLTNTIMAEKLDIPLTKTRRWTKEFLPPDPLATRRSGYTRQFSENDGFMVYVSGYLVSELGFSFAVARGIMKELSPWIYKIGLLPDIPSSVKRLGIDRKINHYEVHFLPMDNNTGWSHEIVGVTAEEISKAKDELGREYYKFRRDFVTFQLPELIAFDYKPPRRVKKTLPISELLTDFLIHIKTDSEEWKGGKLPPQIFEYIKKFAAMMGETSEGDGDSIDATE
jgi:hypothetical protein